MGDGIALDIWLSAPLGNGKGPPGAATDRLAQCLSEGGTLVNYGMMGGEPCQVAPSSLIFRDITLRGFWLAKWFRDTSLDARRTLYGELTQLVVSGALHARIHATYPVDRIQEAVAAANEGERDGKILVTGGAGSGARVRKSYRWQLSHGAQRKVATYEVMDYHFLISFW